jgi:hypothetical protein
MKKLLTLMSLLFISLTSSAQFGFTDPAIKFANESQYIRLDYKRTEVITYNDSIANIILIENQDYIIVYKEKTTFEKKKGVKTPVNKHIFLIYNDRFEENIKTRFL